MNGDFCSDGQRKSPYLSGDPSPRDRLLVTREQRERCPEVKFPCEKLGGGSKGLRLDSRKLSVMVATILTWYLFSLSLHLCIRLHKCRAMLDWALNASGSSH